VKLKEFAFKRHSPRGTWVYALLLGLYIMYALGYLGEFAGGAETIWRYWPLAVPVAIILIQIGYPTRFGWALVLCGCGAFALACVYYLLRNNLWTHPPQSAGDTAGFMLGAGITAVSAALFTAILWIRPREPVAPA
jgi:hypothetical protein